MIFRLVLLFFVVIQICASSSIKHNATLTRHDAIVKPRFEGFAISNRDSFPWLVILVQLSTSKQLGVGAIISPRYALFTATVVNPVKSNPADATVYSDVDQRAFLLNGISHPATEILVHPQLSGTKYNLAMVKVCPSFTGITPVVLSASRTGYAASTTAKVLKYFDLAPGVVYLEKSLDVNVRGSCSKTVGWNTTLMICLQFSEFLYAQIQDHNLPTVIDSKLAGFLMTVQSGTIGEQVSDISQYVRWIRNVEILATSQ